jgi:TctA family transporter
LRTALVLSFGDPAVFVTRPLSAAMLLAAFLLLALVLLPAIRRRKSEIFAESSR